MRNLTYIKYKSSSLDVIQKGGGEIFAQTDSYYFTANISDPVLISKSPTESSQNRIVEAALRNSQS